MEDIHNLPIRRGSVLFCIEGMNRINKPPVIPYRVICVIDLTVRVVLFEGVDLFLRNITRSQPQAPYLRHTVSRNNRRNISQVVTSADLQIRQSSIQLIPQSS